MPADRITFTVFTPTYNRGHVLHRVHDSLAAQTFRDFEWLIVDNASDDGTESLVAGWIDDGSIPMRYLRNTENIGRQGSWRRAIQEARGELFLEVRSADTIPADALERFDYHWRSIPRQQRVMFSAVSALCVNEHGALIGTRFPQDILDSDSIEIRARHKVTGLKSGFQRTAVLREATIPVIPGYVGAIPESLVWRSIARRYRTRYVNEVLHVYWEDQPHGLSRPVEPWRNAPGRLLDAEDRLNADLHRWFVLAPLSFLREAVAYVTSSMHAGRAVAQQAAMLRGTEQRAIWLASLPAGLGFYLVQRYLPWLARHLPNP